MEFCAPQVTTCSFSQPADTRAANLRIKSAKKAASGRKATRARQGGQRAKRISGLDAAAKALAEAKEPMICRQIVEVAFENGYWKSNGQTPHATIYSAMISQIAANGKQARFKRTSAASLP